MEPLTLLWILAGLVAMRFSLFVWENARRGHTAAWSEFALAGLGGYLAWNFNADLWSEGNVMRAVVIALWVSAASPTLSWWYYGDGGTYRRWTVRAVAALLLFSFTAAALLLLDFKIRDALLSALAVTAAGFIFPKRLRRLIRSLPGDWQRWRQRRREQAEHRLAQRREEAEITGLRQQTESAEAKLVETERQLTRLRSREEQQAQRKNRRRLEILEQVKEIRRREQEQLQIKTGPTPFHPSSLGFLLAEAGRVLRHEIARGERIPAIEADTFLIEVIENLLAADDFEKRYLHRRGRKVIRCLNRFLAGDQPLGNVLKSIRKVGLQDHQLAPVPPPGAIVPTLIEEWLVPYRRWQEHQRQLYVAGRHPFQPILETHFQAFFHEPPGAEKWRDSSDASPNLFVHGRSPDNKPRNRLASLRQRLQERHRRSSLS